MLLEYDNTTCSACWRIDEKIPTGYCRVYYVYGGEVHYADSRRQIRLRPGTLYVFPSASPYRMRQNAADPLRCTFMHIDVSPSMVAKLIECRVEENGFLWHLLHALAAAIGKKDRRLVYALAEVFELYVVEHRLVAAPVHPLSDVLRYIAGHIGENITLGRLSAMAGYNEQYFVRLFRRSVGMTPYQYVISLRMKEARLQLTKGRTVTQAAETTGYRDIKSFSRAFKKGVGTTPSAFRKGNTVLP
ncbi:MAG: helix-turn-helix transcriptional regulator [Clostridiales bacterium]|nr:helix-turn-helix transcriptional regulator [Clostridiales bacterium]